MKKALLTMALLVVPFFSIASIYDTAQDVAVPKTIENCNTPQSPSEHVAAYNAANNLPRTESTWYQDARRLVRIKNTYFDSSSDFCAVYYEYRTSGGTVNSDGSKNQTYNSVQQSQVNGTKVEAPSCLNLDEDQGSSYSESHNVLGKNSDGVPGCYTPQSLADADTCELKDADGLYESFISSESGVSCMEKSEDGSICPVKKNFEITSNASGNTSYFYEYDANADPSTCYQQNTVEPPQPSPLEKDETFPSNIGDCTVSNGINMCKENPINACDSNGNCLPGCGSIKFGEQQEFVCLSGDIDGDGIPDYQDRDKDGDGILNEDDLDSDGDGIEDPINTTPNTLRTPHQSSIEQLLGQIAQNTSGGTGGGSGTGATASQIGESVAEEIEDKLVEQADFSGSEFEQSINAKIESTDTAIEEFLENNEKDLTNAFDESEFQGSFSSLKAALSPNGCSAQFGIPFTNSNLDLCEPASKAQPFLYVIFAISTFIYCMRRIQSTARSE